jgi:hypothetical protein
MSRGFYIRAMHFRCVYSNLGTIYVYVRVWFNITLSGPYYNVFITF